MIDSESNTIRWPCYNKNGYVRVRGGDGVAVERPYCMRMTKMDQVSFALLASGSNNGVCDDSSGKPRIRYLTPRESLRLMGQKDDAIDRLYEVESVDSVRYRLAGNSIVVNVLEAIFKGIYIDRTFRNTPKTLEDFI